MGALGGGEVVEEDPMVEVGVMVEVVEVVRGGAVVAGGVARVVREVMVVVVTLVRKELLA